MKRIDVDDLTFAYAGGFALGPVDLRLAQGSATALIGPSGSGKTTLLRCLAGLERPRSGTIRFDGAEVSSPAHVLPPHRRRIGYVFQSGALWPHLNALQHLTFAAPDAPRGSCTALLERVGLGGKEQRKPAQLSAGEAQRLALARALVTRPDFLFLDEPLRAVDVHLRDELALLVRDLAGQHGVTLLLVTHDRDEALAMADDLVVLRQGRIVEQGPALRLLREPRTAYAAAFLCQAACLRVEPGHNGSVGSAFGLHARPADAYGELALVLLPGDAEEVDSGASGGSHPRARVLRLEASAGGALAAVELEGQTVRVACRTLPAPGSTIALRLRGAPRLLPLAGDAAASDAAALRDQAKEPHAKERPAKGDRS